MTPAVGGRRPDTRLIEVLLVLVAEVLAGRLREGRDGRAELLVVQTRQVARMLVGELAEHVVAADLAQRGQHRVVEALFDGRQPHQVVARVPEGLLQLPGIDGLQLLVLIPRGVLQTVSAILKKETCF